MIQGALVIFVSKLEVSVKCHCLKKWSRAGPPCRGHSLIKQRACVGRSVWSHEYRNKPPTVATGTNRNLCQSTMKRIPMQSIMPKLWMSMSYEPESTLCWSQDRLCPLFLLNPAALPFCHRRRLDQSRPVHNDVSGLFFCRCFQIDFWMINYTVFSV